MRMASGVASNSFNVPHGLDLAAVINDHAVAHVFHVRQQMAAQDDGLAAPGQRQDQILDLAAADGVEAGGRLVEDDQVGVVDERLGQADAALHALGELADRPRPGLAQADHFEQLLGAVLALVPGQAEEVAEEIQRLAGIEVAVEVGFLGQVADARLGGDVAGRMAEDLDVPFGRIQQPEQQLDGGGLAGAVRARAGRRLRRGRTSKSTLSTARALGRPQKSLKTLVRPRTETTGFAVGAAAGGGCQQ